METLKKERVSYYNQLLPYASVRISEIRIDVRNRRFELLLSGKTMPKSRWLKPKKVSGYLSTRLYNWLTKFRVRKHYDSSVGKYVVSLPKTEVTGFQLYLEKINMEFVPGILSKLVFESDNTSDNYYEHPFRLSYYSDTDNYVLSLVNEVPKKQVRTLDPETGKTIITYVDKLSKSGKPLYYSKDRYLRYIKYHKN